MNEIREMIRDLVCELYKQKHIFITSRKQVNMIVERIVYKLDPKNIPDIPKLKKLIEKETS